MHVLPIDKLADALLKRWLIGLGLSCVLWVLAYSQLTAFADALVSVLGLSRQTHFGEAVHFFFYDTPKAVSYTHLDVYKRQRLRWLDEVRQFTLMVRQAPIVDREQTIAKS